MANDLEVNKKLSYSVKKDTKIASITGITTLDDGGYSTYISDKKGVVSYYGISGSFDLFETPLFKDPQGIEPDGTYNWTHPQPQNGSLDSDGYYYTYIGGGSSSGAKNDYIKLAGITIPFNDHVTRIIKWKTNLNGGSFEYIGQCIIMGTAHANFQLNGGYFYLSGTTTYGTTGVNTLDGYKDIRLIQIPKSFLKFTKVITDNNIYATKAIYTNFKNFNGIKIRDEYMYERSPDFDQLGLPSNSLTSHYQWMYSPANNNRVFTSNGQNIFMYSVDKNTRTWTKKIPDDSIYNLGLSTVPDVYSSDKNRILVNSHTKRSMEALNSWYFYSGGRYLQNIFVVNNNAYFLFGGASLAHIDSARYMIKIININNGMLVGEFDLEDYTNMYGLPSSWHIERESDSEGIKYNYLTDGNEIYFQESEDLYVTEDEQTIIICLVQHVPRYIKININWDYI